MATSSKSKTIAVNTRFLIHNKLEGIGRFTCESLQRITQQHPEHRFVFLFDRPHHSKFIFADNVEAVAIFPPARHPFLWYAWFEWAIPRALKKIQPDLFLSTDGYCSLSTNIPTVLVMHDIAYEHFPEQVPFWARHYYRHYSKKYAQKAQRIATVSSYTRNDVAQLYGINPSKIDVVYNGANDVYRPLNLASQQAVQQQYAQGCPYFLFVGAIHPRKNLHNMLRAYDAFKTQSSNPIKFLVAGRKAWQSNEAFEVYQNMQYKDEVIFLGHLQLEELAKVYASSLALVYASLFEGFGIPIVEAMSAETAVITANTSSMPEVGGDAAILVDPLSVAQIQTAMHDVYSTPNLRADLIAKGRLQKQKFSWQQTADKLWACVEKAIG